MSVRDTPVDVVQLRTLGAEACRQRRPQSVPSSHTVYATNLTGGVVSLIESR
ncbi:hypothetical protein H7J50_14285 [Mycobacterium intermedium]|uniref:hypothetical protein n=1 Tax=Mycobacterium intermedium TaxID=28445 RepID=UPI0012E9E9A0|nr:hypothetical protein [Mycobacterium intermedium]MCV6964967.1 hypothetical protein [Mycobacterium intermedium]